MKILGISAFYHDSSACLIEDGKIIAACQEERLTRIKHDSNFPVESIKFVLRAAKCEPKNIDAIVFYEKPFLKFERLLETYLAFAPKGFLSFKKAMPVWLKEKLFQKKLLSEELLKLNFSETQCSDILFSNHHLSHAASAFFPSPFTDSLVVTMDGVGEWDTTTVYLGSNNKLTKLKELHFPHSLGLLYSAFTYHCGFKVNSGEYKLMGLAPFGKPVYADLIRKNLIDIKDDGSFRLNLKYFDYCTGLSMTNKNFENLFNCPARKAEEKMLDVHKDLAASIQVVLEEVVLKMCRSLKAEYNTENLCLAGGVALNCVANGKIYEENIFKNIWVQPAAGDAGGSLGAALIAYYHHFNNIRTPEKTDSMKGAFIGPDYHVSDIELFLQSKKAPYEKLNSEDLNNKVVDLIVQQKVIGWFQGKMEFGPRALGNRSIIADPRSPDMQKNLNLKIKFRESFRPFAPAVLEEHCADWFEYHKTSPYMLMVAQVKKNKLTLPSVTHIDGSARIQTVNRTTNEKFYELLQCFNKKTDVPVLINTSFNVRGEPVVCTPQDAYRCFMGTNMDVLVLENLVLVKEQQPKENFADYKDLFDLD